jgi:hypothetical protein
MADTEQVKQETRELLQADENDPLDHITDELITEYEGLVGEADSGVLVVRADGSQAADEDIAEAGPESTKVYYGNHSMRLGTCFYWKTNGVGQPCGSGFTAKACNWRSVQATQLQLCPGVFWGYRFTFTY